MAAHMPMPNGADPEQFQRMHATMMQMAAGGGMPFAPSYSSMPAASGAVDPMQAYLQMLHQFQGLQQQGMASMPVPGMASYSHPSAAAESTVRVSVEGMKFQYQLTEEDIRKVFGRYGQLKKVAVDETAASSLVTFMRQMDAEGAIRDLDGKVLSGLDGTLRIKWVSQPNASPFPASAPAPFASYPGVPFPASRPFVPPAPGTAGTTSSKDTSAAGLVAPAADSKAGNAKGSRKFTCRFMIGIENDKEFHVARRVIGAKGANMKHIVGQTDAKLRLRGVGSGYLEGAAQKESTEPLQLCISCTSAEGYQNAVRQVSELLERVHEDYRQFCKDRAMPVPDLKVSFSENQLEYSSSPSAPPSGVGRDASQGDSRGAPFRASQAASSGRGRQKGKKGGGGRRSEIYLDHGTPGPNAPPKEEVLSLINERNEARRASNFEEADRIRDLLLSRGVTLMDEPGGRGKAAEVTAWRYWNN